MPEENPVEADEILEEDPVSKVDAMPELNVV